VASSTVDIERAGRVAVVRLARPHRANAVNVQMLLDLRDALGELEADDAVRVLVVTGAGRHFCGGWDLTETAPVPVGLDINTCFGLVTKPLIAALNGSAMGGGCEIALACDVRFAAAHASIGLPEIKFGELPAAGGTVRLARIVGASSAKRMILTGEPLTAEQAHRIGLVDTVSLQDVLSDALELATTIAARALYATRAAKLLVDHSADRDQASALAYEKQVVATMASPEQRAAARQDAVQGNGTYARIFASEPA
jgi:enoyl-CoA hydratase/carnithine racemase